VCVDLPATFRPRNRHDTKTDARRRLCACVLAAVVRGVSVGTTSFVDVREISERFNAYSAIDNNERSASFWNGFSIVRRAHFAPLTVRSSRSAKRERELIRRRLVSETMSSLPPTHTRCVHETRTIRTTKNGVRTIEIDESTDGSLYVDYNGRGQSRCIRGVPPAVNRHVFASGRTREKTDRPRAFQPDPSIRLPELGPGRLPVIGQLPSVSSEPSHAAVVVAGAVGDRRRATTK